MSSSDRHRLSVAIVDVPADRAADFHGLAAAIEELTIRKHYGRTDTIRDEANHRQFYIVHHWNDAAAAEGYHTDPDLGALMARLCQIARVTYLVNGARRASEAAVPAERRVRVQPDRRAGFERRRQNVGGPTGIERRSGKDRRCGERRSSDRRGGPVDLVAEARRAREFASAAFSNFKVGAALETSTGAVITGCNVENATYGLTVCAERVAMFKALSEGHRRFTRIAIVADTDEPTPPCGACRQILWEFAGDLAIELANLTERKGRYRLGELLPLPFDARLL